METITKNYQVFTFDELSKEAKEKALDDARDVNVEYHDWYEYVYEQWNEKLTELGYENTDISFSGFWSQGDGASFTAKSINVRDWCKANKKLKKYAKFLSGEAKGDYEMTFWVERTDSHYSHYNTCDVKADYYTINKSMNAEQEKQYYELIDEIEDNREELSRELYRDLEKEYEGLTSDEAVKDFFDCNDTKFLENGSVFTE